MIVIRRTRAILLFLLTALALQAQTWEALTNLKPGESIRITTATGDEHKGDFTSVTPDAISLKTKKTEMSIEKAKVRKVDVRSGARRGRNAAIGAAIGVAIAVTVDQTLGHFLRNEGGDNRAVTYIAPIALFGGIGAALPAYRTVYRVR